MKTKYWARIVTLNLGILPVGIQTTLALPPPEDIPEEVLRTEIITEARSPVDGQILTAAEYTELEAQLAQSPYAPELNAKTRQLIFLLQIRKLLRTITPL
ncbi:MAG: hypothetical protein WA865_04550 [Spirulinaceae cyanobacterium]